MLPGFSSSLNAVISALAASMVAGVIAYIMFHLGVISHLYFLCLRLPCVSLPHFLCVSLPYVRLPSLYILICIL